MTLLDIEKNVYHRLDKNTTNIDPITKARIDLFINDRYRELMRLDGIDLRDEPALPVTSRAGEPRLTLSPTATQIYNVIDTRNRIKLQERTLSWIRERDAAQPAQVQGTPVCYAVLNEAGMLAQPDPGATLQIVSSLVGDTRSFRIEVHAPAPFQYFAAKEGTLNGTTPVALDSWASIYRLQLNGVLSGSIVTLSQTAPTAKVLAQLAQFEPTTIPMMQSLASHGWALWLWPTPSAAITYAIDYMRPSRDLTAPTDEPTLPYDFHTLLVWGACEDECLKMDDDRANYFRKKWEEDVKALKAFLHRARGQRWVPNNRPAAWSDLGPNFPAQR